MPSVKNAAVSHPRAAPSLASPKPKARASLMSAVGHPQRVRDRLAHRGPVPRLGAEVRDEVGHARVGIEETGDRDARALDAADAFRRGATDLAQLRDDPGRAGVRGGRRDVDEDALDVPSAALLEHDDLDRRAAEVEPEVPAHRTVQPPSTVSTAPVTKGAVAR